MSVEIQNQPTFEYPEKTKLTSCYEEPWNARGEGGSGRKPPYFAYYTRVYCKKTTNVSKLIHNLKMLTNKTSAHYLWFDNDTNAIEIWAHPFLINNVKQMITDFVEKCDMLTSNEYFMTSIKCDNRNTNIGLLIANFKCLINRPMHIWYNNDTKAVDIWAKDIQSAENIIEEIHVLINNCKKRRYNNVSLSDYV